MESNDPKETWTRAEAEAHQRTVTKTCRGPITSEAAAVRDALLRDDRKEEAAAEDAAGRAGCGADLNEVVLAHPLDGKEHVARCPQCGREFRWTAPWYPGLAG